MASIASSFQTGFIAGQFATGQKEFSAKNAGIALLWAYAGSKTNLLTRPFQAFLRKSGCLSNSFSADTLVDTKDGLRRIDLIKKGELVLSYNEITGENEYQPVMAVMKSSKRTTLFVIELETGSIIEATAEHLIYADGKWTQAQFIKESSELIDDTGSLVKVRKTSTLLRTETVVDLTVKQNHNFFVSKDKVLVHNISPCEKAAQALAKAVPKGCTTNLQCDDFTVAFEKILLSKKEKFKGKRLCVKAPRNISNGAGKVISTNGHHSAVQVGELVFDNWNPNGVPYSEWASGLGLNEGHQGFSVSSENMTGNYNGCINK